MRKNQTDFNSSWQKKGLQVSRKPTGHSFKTSEKKRTFEVKMRAKDTPINPFSFETQLNELFRGWNFKTTHFAKS